MCVRMQHLGENGICRWDIVNTYKKPGYEKKKREKLGLIGREDRL